jgi:hypothetical protein
MEYALALAILAALAGACVRNVTAAALLGSFAFSTTLCELGVPFNPILWMVIDVVVILFIIRPDMKRRDLVILAIFLPIWALYITMPPWASTVIDGLVVAQMLLTFPVRRTWGASQAFIARLRDDNGMKMVRA